MKFSRRAFLGASLAASGTLIAPQTLAVPAPQVPPGTKSAPVAATAVGPDNVLAQALAALERHRDRIAFADRIGIADYTAHSREHRFHIVDVAAGAITRSYLVAHGRGSDPANSGFAERFSNVPGSNASSRGSYLTGQAYVGKHGRSRRLHGLEPDNDRAFERAIVIHGASYVDEAMARNVGRVGRSLGCFAFEQGAIGEVLELLGEGRLLFAAT